MEDLLFFGLIVGPLAIFMFFATLYDYFKGDKLD